MEVYQDLIFTMDNRLIKKTIPLIFWASLWSIGARLIDNDIILPGPGLIGQEILRLLGDGSYWSSFFSSFGKIGLGLVLALGLGLVLAYGSFLFKGLKLILEPFMALIKTSPVAALTILLLVWISSSKLAIVLIILVLLPPVYSDILNGLEQIDGDLLEMVQVFKPGKRQVFTYIHLPQIKKSLRDNLGYSMGFAWKAGISGEILAQAHNSLGNNIYKAKIYLNIGELFAHIIILVLFSSMLEALLLGLWRRK